VSAFEPRNGISETPTHILSPISFALEAVVRRFDAEFDLLIRHTLTRCAAITSFTCGCAIRTP